MIIFESSGHFLLIYTFSKKGLVPFKQKKTNKKNNRWNKKNYPRKNCLRNYSIKDKKKQQKNPKILRVREREKINLKQLVFVRRNINFYFNRNF